jgi:hypothetical protein
VQNSLQKKEAYYANAENGFNELMKDIKDVPGIPTDVDMSVKFCDYCSHEATWSCKSRCKGYEDMGPAKRKSPDTPASGKKCRVHPNGKHSNEES